MKQARNRQSLLNICTCFQVGTIWLTPVEVVGLQDCLALQAGTWLNCSTEVSDTI